MKEKKAFDVKKINIFLNHREIIDSMIPFLFWLIEYNNKSLRRPDIIIIAYCLISLNLSIKVGV